MDITPAFKAWSLLEETGLETMNVTRCGADLLAYRAYTEWDGVGRDVLLQN